MKIEGRTRRTFFAWTVALAFALTAFLLMLLTLFSRFYYYINFDQLSISFTIYVQILNKSYLILTQSDCFHVLETIFVLVFWVSELFLSVFCYTSSCLSLSFFFNSFIALKLFRNEIQVQLCTGYPKTSYDSFCLFGKEKRICVSKFILINPRETKKAA